MVVVYHKARLVPFARVLISVTSHFILLLCKKNASGSISGNMTFVADSDSGIAITRRIASDDDKSSSDGDVVSSTHVWHCVNADNQSLAQ